jgi:hypothetical protein
VQHQKYVTLRAQQSGGASSLLLPRCEGKKIITCAHPSKREDERLKKQPFLWAASLFTKREKERARVCSNRSSVLRARVCVHCFERETSIATLSGNYKFNVCRADVRVPRNFHSCALCAKVIQLFLRERRRTRNSLSVSERKNKKQIFQGVLRTLCRANTIAS